MASGDRQCRGPRAGGGSPVTRGQRGLGVRKQLLGQIIIDGRL
jgi:hypothetical protein